MKGDHRVKTPADCRDNTFGCSSQSGQKSAFHRLHLKKSHGRDKIDPQEPNLHCFQILITGLCVAFWLYAGMAGQVGSDGGKSCSLPYAAPETTPDIGQSALSTIYGRDQLCDSLDSGKHC